MRTRRAISISAHCPSRTPGSKKSVICRKYNTKYNTKSRTLAITWVEACFLRVRFPHIPAKAETPQAQGLRGFLLYLQGFAGFLNPENCAQDGLKRQCVVCFRAQIQHEIQHKTARALLPRAICLQRKMGWKLLFKALFRDFLEFSTIFSMSVL